MPTYDYACRACGHAFEHFQSLSDKLLRTCPECGKRTLDRLFGTGIGVVFKGSGFYETDYKRAGGKPSKQPGEGKADKKSPAKKDPGDKPAGSPKGDSSSQGGKSGGDQGAGPKDS